MSLVGRFSGDGEQDMIAAALLGLSLVVNAAFEPTDLSPNAGADGRQMTARQKFSAMRPVVGSATDCVVRAVTADPRFRRTPAADMNELIVASMGSCADAMRALIETHDRLFGEGSGEAFFMGPYLDSLPVSVNKIVNGVAAPADPPSKP